MRMSHSREMKNGFTMVELLVVVSIMGILSVMGVSSLRSAIINNRVKDAAINVTAYLERVASETNRLSEKVCVKVDDRTKKTIFAAKGECSSATSLKNAISHFELEGSLSFENATGSDCKKSWYSGANFEPKFGLSAAPLEGCIVVKHVSGEKRARALKTSNKNNIISQISYDGSTSNWTNF